MNHPPSPPEDPRASMSRGEFHSALFANMVVQQSNMALMLLGKIAHPETGEFIEDLDSARMFIDQLEMLEAKTKGNLSKQEEDLLKQALGSLRMAFVEAVDTPPRQEAPKTPPATPEPESTPAPAAKSPTAEAPPATEESRKKFSKKY